MTRTLPDVSFARIASEDGRHVFFWAAPAAGLDELLAVWNRMDGMLAERFTFGEPAIVAAAQDWLADKLQEHEKATVMIGSIERGKWVDWNLRGIPRPAVPTS
ncbi:hypothetical protein [Streptomyces sp. NBC_01233]|uniref:hypothetical protein n=1 Tax=Streptomyces sp. NBC_01233 TaxID=2903787 RepID=UPI002E1322A6|nr:hypothetical protein OG332_47655 [Streptomyces sp. NBC_01233]